MFVPIDSLIYSSFYKAARVTRWYSEVVKCPPLESEVSSSPSGGIFFLLLFLIFNDKSSWQFVKKFAYASFANLLLPIIRGLLLGMTWPVYKNNSLFTSSKRRKISNINKQNICKKIYKQEKKTCGRD